MGGAGGCSGNPQDQKLETWTQQRSMERDARRDRFSFLHLSSSIALKRTLLTLYLTENQARQDMNLFIFRCLQVLETIEWE
jgi:hypothetical protein